MKIPLPEAFARTRRQVGPALAAASARLSPELRRVVEYHRSWCDADGTEPALLLKEEPLEESQVERAVALIEELYAVAEFVTQREF